MTDSVHLFKVELELVTPGGVLMPQLDEGPDAVPLQGPDETYGLPTTSLAGSLRAHVATRVPPHEVDRLFGRVEREEASASRIWFLGGEVRPTGVHERHQTAIDRRRGAARNRTLRQFRLLAPGTTFTLHLRAHDLDREEHQSLVDHLASWAPYLGRGVSIGHGETRSAGLHHARLDLTDPADVEMLLDAPGPEIFTVWGDIFSTVEVSPPQREACEWSLRTTSPLSIGSGQTVRTSDGPQVAQVVKRRIGDRTELFVPASTWKGVLRARIEYILRSMWPVDRSASPCLDQTCGECVPCHLFGNAGGVTTRRALVRFEDTAIVGQVENRTHVAIDRFTGGAADGLLYTREVVASPATTELRVVRLTADDREWEWTTSLVELALRDLDRGVVGLGWGTTRGMGSVEVIGDRSAQLGAARQRVRELIDSWTGTCMGEQV